MLETRHDTRTVQELLNLHSHRQLNLEPAFQRQSVWSTRDRRLLIESLLDGVPIPAIYLYKQSGRNGRIIYDVIDGKQRLETILLFMGRGPLADSEDDLLVRVPYGDGALDWAGWRDLTRLQKTTVRGARIPTIEVEGELSEIIGLFVRINSTGKRLTPQERRHAHFYNNPVLKTAQQLSDRYESELRRSGVVSPSQIQRMKHVELITDLLLSVHLGKPLDKKAKIDQLIGGYGADDRDVPASAANLKRAIDLVNAILPDLKTTRFRRVTDYYTLVLLIHRLREEGMTITAHDSERNRLARELLVDFGRGVDEVTETLTRGRSLQRHQDLFRDYYMTVREGTDSAKNRNARERILRDVLDGVFDERDRRRGFNATQRRILWHASSKKRCSLCKRPIARWEELAIDHVVPHVRGGRTSLANAALAHRKCNASKGAR